MKRSVFLEQIKNGNSRGNSHETVYDHFAREAVIAAEAAGVIWDPEEEPLPERMILFLDGAIGFQYGPEGTGWTKLGIACNPHRGIAAEVVRRYNAWPELERLAEEMKTRTMIDRCRLSEILRGVQ